jgi:magnesium transporter
MEPELRAMALIEMPVARAVAVLAEIDPDEAADTLADLPDHLAEQLLAGLPRREAEALRDLASHPEHSAGGLMTTDFVTVARGLTAALVLEHIRHEKPEDEALAIIFVLDDDGHLVGTISLGDLVLADPGSRLADVMDGDPVTVVAETGEEEVAQLMTRYNLLALPVVDEAGCLEGVVTLDDALEAVLPEEWRQRLPRLFR